MMNQIAGPEFLSLVQHVELSRAGWLDKAIERFVIAALNNSAQTKTAGDLAVEISSRYKVEIDAGRVTSHLDRLVAGRVVVQVPGGRGYVLSEEARRSHTAQLDQAKATEQAASAIFRDRVAPIAVGDDRTPEELWQHFHSEFLVPLIKALGATTYTLLTGGDLKPVDVTLERYLNAYQATLRDALQKAVYAYLDPANGEVRSYVLSLLNAYLILEAVSLSPADLAAVSRQLASTPTFNVFVDTNFLLSVLGLHDNPSNDAAQGLVRLGKALASHIKVRFYVTPLTLEETQRVLAAHRDSLKGLRLTPGMAQAALSRASSGITLHFLDHVSRGGTPNSAEAYFEPYLNNLLTILRSHGAELYNENVDRYRTRQDVIDDINLQLEHEKKTLPQDRRKTYEQLLHDMVLWHLASDKRPERLDSPVEAGHWIVTLDHRFVAFDRFKNRSKRRAIPLCLAPTVLSQLLQFWMPRSDDLEQVVLGSMRMPLMFHFFDRESERVTVDILRALGKYEAIARLPREAVTSIIVNDALRARFGGRRSEEEAIELVKDALTEEFDRTKSALERALEAERLVKAELARKEEAVSGLSEALEGTTLAAQRAEAEGRKTIDTLKEDIGRRDLAIAEMREELAGLSESLAEMRLARTVATRIQSFILIWTVAEVAWIIGAIFAARVAGSWAGLGYWTRVSLLVLAGQLPLAFGAEWHGGRLPEVRGSAVYSGVRKARKWLAGALVLTAVAVFHELLASWFQTHVWHP